MKKRIFTIFIMVAALAMFAPVAEGSDFKVTGGGWIPVGDSKASFGLHIECEEFWNDEIKGWDYWCDGNVQYNDRDHPIKIHGTNIEYEGPVGSGYMFGGSCRVQYEDYKVEDGTFYLIVDEQELSIFISAVGEVDYSINAVPLGGGKIKIQVK